MKLFNKILKKYLIISILFLFCGCVGYEYVESVETKETTTFSHKIESWQDQVDKAD